MNHDEILKIIKELKIEYKLNAGKDLVTIDELESFLTAKIKKPRSRALKSLKGLNL